MRAIKASSTYRRTASRTWSWGAGAAGATSPSSGGRTNLEKKYQEAPCDPGWPCSFLFNGGDWVDMCADSCGDGCGRGRGGWWEERAGEKGGRSAWKQLNGTSSVALTNSRFQRGSGHTTAEVNSGGQRGGWPGKETASRLITARRRGARSGSSGAKNAGCLIFRIS